LTVLLDGAAAQPTRAMLITAAMTAKPNHAALPFIFHLPPCR
jgi:hypothetical protein